MTTITRRGMQRLALVALLVPVTALAAPQPREPYADHARCGYGSAFIVENRSEQPVLQVYVRVTGAPEWGTDRLGEKVLAKGEAVELDIGPQIVDVLAVRADGRAFLTQRQHSCRLAIVRVEADRAVSIP
jgi:hypothetical protein